MAMKKLTAPVDFTVEELEEIVGLVQAAWNEGFDGDVLDSVFEKSKQFISSLNNPEDAE